MSKTKAIAEKLPWTDRAGRFSPLKATTLILVSLPALWLLYRTVFLGLGARPITEAIHRVGDWTVYLLLITLAVTPARRLFDMPKLIHVRRILGLSAFFYIALHFVFYVIDSKFDVLFIGSEIVLRVYLLIGFAAMIGILLLAVTSTDGWIKRLGAMKWNRLHKAIYVITALGILHYYMQSKVDVSSPVLMTGFFYWLMGYRMMAKRGYKEGLVPLVVLSVSAALLTALTEAAWYGIASGAPADRVLLANLDFSFSIRPAWWVLFTGLGVTAVAELRKRLRIGGSPRGATPAGRTA
ncbi:sulfite oxidase heme-binding subunit YedZ [Bauldia sp.]|uniref:sulfite oxidase heme-binding subunit YedZ n=1 Tax=Bauldia sp. TaxID=2575872 RepID=UPI003BAA00F9